MAESTARQAHALLQATVPGTYPAGVAQCLAGLALESGGQADAGAELVRESHAILRVNAVYEPCRSACRVPLPES